MLRPPQANNSNSQFHDMAMDTKGFQQILELSKKEEEERMLKQSNIKKNEEKLLQRGLQQSEETSKKEAQMLDQEAEMLK